MLSYSVDKQHGLRLILDRKQMNNVTMLRKNSLLNKPLRVDDFNVIVNRREIKATIR